MSPGRPVRAEAAEGDGEHEGGGPAVALRPVALHPLAEHLLPQAHQGGPRGAVSYIPGVQVQVSAPTEQYLDVSFDLKRLQKDSGEFFVSAMCMKREVQKFNM